MSLRVFSSESVGLSWKVVIILLLLANGCQGQSIDGAALLVSIIVIIIIVCASMPICIICLTVALICTCRKYRKSKAQGQELDEVVEPTSLHVPQTHSAPYVRGSVIAATNGTATTHGSAPVQDATYEYIADSELPMGENRAYDVCDRGIRVGENEAYGYNEVPATDLEPNEAYNYRQPVPTPNIAYGGHNTRTDHDKFTEETYEYIS